ncbi:MAG: glutathione S-transferase family protein [Burkholderiales bacterium]|nr:glutathione S-transferase family protein [Burkholderiales bacterium]
MPDLILHNYPNSPFAEKVRLILGYKGLEWHSVQIPRVMPKPDLMPLTGGYRRTPVMQIGADVYCDSACIVRELERRYPETTLFPDGTNGVATMIGAWSDRVFFFDAVGVVFGTLGATVPNDLKEDRYTFSEGMIDIDRYQRDQAQLRSQLRAHLFWLERALEDGRLHVLGDKPTWADFCLYHPMWMVQRRVPELGAANDMPRTLAWFERMTAFGHGRPVELDAKEALRIAQTATPAPVKLGHPELPDGIPAGTAVTVAADDYGKDPVAGTLVAANAQRIVIRRTDPAVGEVNVHFPRAGFVLSKAA